MIALHLGKTKKRRETRQKNFVPEAAGVNPFDYGDFFSFQGCLWRKEGQPIGCTVRGEMARVAGQLIGSPLHIPLLGGYPLDALAVEAAGHDTIPP